AVAVLKLGNASSLTRPTRCWSATSRFAPSSIRGGRAVPRCDSNDPRLFSTFCPKAIGLNGRKMPDTTLSRCIIIDLKRKKRSDRVEHFRHIDDTGLANLRRQAQRWTRDNVATLETAVPELPAGFDNRLGDNWRLMLAIADLAGGEWAD